MLLVCSYGLQGPEEVAVSQIRTDERTVAWVCCARWNRITSFMLQQRNIPTIAMKIFAVIFLPV